MNNNQAPNSEEAPNREIPPILPPPKPFQPDAGNATYGGGLAGEKFESKKRWKHKSHPNHLRPAGRHMIARILTTLLIMAILLLAFLLYLGPGRFVAKGYQVVNLGPSPDLITAAPTSPTCYLSSGSIRYQVPITQTSVAFIAREIILEGDFYEQVSLTAAKISASSNARFAKDLELYALNFQNGGITLKGNLTGWYDDNVSIPTEPQP